MTRTNTHPHPPFLPGLVRVGSRRWFLQTGLAGLAGLSLPGLFHGRALARERPPPVRRTSVILYWLSGGPSHLDTWDPKPEAPGEIRGPFDSIAPAVPGGRPIPELS